MDWRSRLLLAAGIIFALGAGFFAAAFFAAGLAAGFFAAWDGAALCGASFFAGACAGGAGRWCFSGCGFSA